MVSLHFKLHPVSNQLTTKKYWLLGEMFLNVLQIDTRNLFTFAACHSYNFNWN